ncbi:MAG: CatB-related O-acetyltransferase [Poseidonibacter sp.]|uniref:CatB-related O-acetyltransferase n=1 Tax=Poseidonibacter sp. TaxID=2321188 RepID=UPI00359D05B8
MDKHSFCGYNCEMINVKIGSFSSIANGVIIGGEMHPIDWVSTSPVFYEGKDSIHTKYSEHKREKSLITTVGHDVWIGQNCLIKQGVKIGNGAVIGMGSVVTKDVLPYSVVAGNPSKLIKMRYNAEIITNLEKLEWWTFGDEELISYAKYVKEPTMFINEIKNRRAKNER